MIPITIVNLLFPCTVPTSPADIKAIAIDQNTVLISWMPPRRPNGEITHYSVYMKTMESGRQFTQHFEVYPPNTQFSVRGLNQVSGQMGMIIRALNAGSRRRREIETRVQYFKS